MTQITAAQVKELREKTGAGMMDCKKALVENGGDMEASVDWLRTKGLAAAAKKAGRVAAEGLVGIVSEGTKGAVVEVNAETDFVGRNEQFQGFVTTLAGVALADGGDMDALANVGYPGGDRTVAEELTQMIATIGENMSLRRAQSFSVNEGVVGSYVHGQTAPGLGRIGVLVALESAGDTAKLEALAKQLAMHVAAANPQSIGTDDLDAEMVARERAVLSEQARESGKPENIIEKMVDGRMRKYFEEVVLSEQVWVMDSDKRVSKVLEEAAGDVGAPVKIVGFARYALGEGIEKEESDLAAEVAAQVAS
jgi:elongation factor Ts